jgi:YidC/Oxa1 family membrane protein insertase
MGFDDIAKGKAPYPKAPDNGWIAIISTISWLRSARQQKDHWSSTRKLGEDLYSAGVIVPLGPIAPGASARAVVPLYAGPQDLDRLQAIAPGLELVVDYGILNSRGAVFSGFSDCSTAGWVIGAWPSFCLR